MNIRSVKVVIPAAGLGTRLLPMTKEVPKEMLPIPFKNKDNRFFLKPMLQTIFEQLYDSGFREYIFIGGRGKRVIEDHFTPDEDFLIYLKNNKKEYLVSELEEFYSKINDSSLIFVNQPKPKGFGDAVYRAKMFTKDEAYLLHAGDDIVVSSQPTHFRKLFEIFRYYEADVVFLVEEIEDPRMYGVIVGDEVEPWVFRVREMIEKPKVPTSHLAAIAIYIFKPIIYTAIEKVKPDAKGEIQLTSALQLLLKWKCKVYALKLDSTERRIDIGTAESYLNTLTNVLAF